MSAETPADSTAAKLIHGSVACPTARFFGTSEWYAVRAFAAVACLVPLLWASGAMAEEVSTSEDAGVAEGTEERVETAATEEMIDAREPAALFNSKIPTSQMAGDSAALPQTGNDDRRDEKLPEVSKAHWIPLGTTIIGIGLGNVVSIVSGFAADSDGGAWVGLGISMAALCIGPSLGQYYLGNHLRATLTMLARFALTAAPFIYAHFRYSAILEKKDDAGDPVHEHPDGQLTLEMIPICFVALAGVVLLSAVDIRSARKEAMRRRARANRSSWSLEPTIVSQKGGIRGGGMTLRVLY